MTAFCYKFSFSFWIVKFLEVSQNLPKLSPLTEVYCYNYMGHSVLELRLVTSQYSKIQLAFTAEGPRMTTCLNLAVITPTSKKQRLSQAFNTMRSSLSVKSYILPSIVYRIKYNIFYLCSCGVIRCSTSKNDDNVRYVAAITCR